MSFCKERFLLPPECADGFISCRKSTFTSCMYRFTGMINITHLRARQVFFYSYPKIVRRGYTVQPRCIVSPHDLRSDMSPAVRFLRPVQNHILGRGIRNGYSFVSLESERETRPRDKYFVTYNGMTIIIWRASHYSDVAWCSVCTTRRK